jgi:hypothetical protein
LRDRRAPLREVLLADVGPRGAGDPAQVDAAVLPEAPVLDGHDRLLHHGRDLVRAHDDAALLAAQDGKHGPPVGGVDVAVLLEVRLRARVELRDLARDRGDEAVREGDA